MQISVVRCPNQRTPGSGTVTYSYNQDHQLTGTTYSDGTTPNVQFGYNGTALSGCTTTPPSLTDSNPVHTRTSMCDGSGATSWAHDEMGRVLTEKRTIVGTSAVTNNIRYSYYKDGELKVLTYPNSNRQITYTVNSSGGYTAGRPLQAVDTTNNINLATAAKYTPHGAVASLTLGASLNAAESYNSRMQPLQVYYTVGTITPDTLNQLQQAACPATQATIMSRSYDFGQAGLSDNGTVQSITNCRDTNRTQNFLYDNLNRITQAYTTGNSPLSTSWGEILTIDPWGNLTNKSPVSGKTNTEPLNVAPANTKNQLNGFCNDSAGNLVLNTGNCPTGTFTPTYSYDAENRLIATGGVTYTYDGDGKRVKKSNGMLYWTGTGSDALLETDLSGNPTAEYVFFNGRRIARIDRPANSVEYYFSDHLGSADVITNAIGGITKESDYYPYGGEIPIVTGDSNRYKFSSKERDTESGLDNFGARFDSSSLGRFMTPDWAARPTAVPYAVFGDPQSLNLYGYVRNDPVSRSDLDGHAAEADAFRNLGDWSGMGGDAYGMTLTGGDPWAYTLAAWQVKITAAVQQWIANALKQSSAPAQNLSDKSEKAILNSNLTGEQAGAFESAVKATGSADGINPNALVGIAFKESSLNPAAQSPTSTASGLFGLTDNIKSTYGLSASDATGTSASAITKQVNAAGSYLHDLMHGSVPAGHPSHQFEIALGYFRGTRRSVNRAIGSKGGYNSMLKLRFGGESLRHYISGVESFQ